MRSLKGTSARVTASAALLAMPLWVVAGCRPDPLALHFDGARAFRDVEQMVAFGPRVPGTPGHEACASWMLARLEPLADRVETQPFQGTVRERKLDMLNVVARFRPQKRPRILLGAHWDSRPTSERDPDPRRHGDPTPGANDSGSGVAVLLELARLLDLSRLDLGVDLVLFDGEDQGTFKQGLSDVLLGSQHLARRISRHNYEFAIIVDMVGREGLELRREPYSVKCCESLVDRIWALAAALGHDEVFLPEDGQPVLDDHWPLQQAGLQAIDLIDLTDPNWHTSSDTPDNISQANLAAVGEVLWTLLLEEAGYDPAQTRGASAAAAASGKRAR